VRPQQRAAAVEISLSCEGMLIPKRTWKAEHQPKKTMHTQLQPKMLWRWDNGLIDSRRQSIKPKRLFFKKIFY
jgi:hypothetical protein